MITVNKHLHLVLLVFRFFVLCTLQSAIMLSRGKMLTNLALKKSKWLPIREPETTETKHEQQGQTFVILEASEEVDYTKSSNVCNTGDTMEHSTLNENIYNIFGTDSKMEDFNLSDIICDLFGTDDDKMDENTMKDNICTSTASCRRQLFTETSNNTDSFATPYKNNQLEGLITPKDNSLENMLKTELEICKDKRILDQKAGRSSSARRKAKKIKIFKEALKKIKNGESVSILPELTVPSSSDFVDLPDGEKYQSDYETMQLEDVQEHNPVSSKNKRQGKKKNYCLYCQKLVKEYCVHIERHHPDTEEGQALKDVTEKNSRLRGKIKREITDRLRKKANAIYNKLVLNEHKHGAHGDCKEIILVKERHHVTQTSENTSECVYCNGWYKRDRMSVHLKLCKSFKLADNLKSQSSTLKSQSMKEHSIPVLLIGEIEGASKDLKAEVLIYMNDDKVKDFATKDFLIMRFASKFHRSRREKVHAHYTASKIRDLANLVMTMKDFNPELNTLEKCCSPAHFDTLVETALKLSGYNHITGQLKTSSMAYRILQPLRIAASIGETDALCKNYRDGTIDGSKVKMFKHFLKMLDKHWANRVGRIAMRNRKIALAGKLQKFALEEDIVKLCSYILTNYRELMDKLDRNYLKETAYDELMELLVCHIMCLIRRRPVDFKRATLLHFSLLDRQDELMEMVKGTNLQHRDNDKDTYLDISEVEDCKNFHIFFVPGKNLEIVPIVLTPLMKKVVDALIRQRTNVGITSKGPTHDKLFLLSNNKVIDPGVCLRKVKRKVPLKSPETLTNNGLRHQAATFSKLHSTHPQYQDFLASALGHTLAVHKKHYELPTSILQKLIVCPVLHNMTLGNTPQDVLLNNRQKNIELVKSKLSAVSSESSNYTTLIEEMVVSDDTKKSCKDNEIAVTNNSEVFFQNFDSDDEVRAHDEMSDEDEEEPLSIKKLNKKQNKDMSTGRPRWKSKEQELIFLKYGEQILKHELPLRSEVKSFFEANKNILGNRSFQSVYTYIHNNARRKQKNVSPMVKQILNR